MISRITNDTTGYPSKFDVPQPLASQWMRRAESLLAERPKTSLVAALATGVVLGWIIKRL